MRPETEASPTPPAIPIALCRCRFQRSSVGRYAAAVRFTAGLSRRALHSAAARSNEDLPFLLFMDKYERGENVGGIPDLVIRRVRRGKPFWRIGG